MKKLNITFCSFPDFAGNAKALYEYMIKRYKDNMNYTWIVYKEKTVEILKKEGIKAILIGTGEFKNYIPKTDVFFTTQGNLDGDKVKTKNSIYVELWHGIGPKPIGFAQKNPSYDDVKGYGNISEIVDYFIVPSEFWKTVWGAIFKVEFSRVKALGMPIFDYFKNSNGKDNLSKVLGLDVGKFDKVMVYMPTFRQGFNHNDINFVANNVFNIKKGYSENKLNKYLKDNNYLLCIKLHPGELSKIDIKENNNIKIIKEDNMIKNKISVNEIMNAFDLMITDFSSVGPEFIFLDKPVLYNMCDIDEYMENRGVIFGNKDFWLAGPSFSTFNELINESYKLLIDETYFKNIRQSKKNLWIGNLKDGGCKQICDFFFDGNLISDKVVRHKSDFINMKEQIKKSNQTIEEQKNLINYLQSEKERLNLIENSKGWKLLEQLRKLRR